MNIIDHPYALAVPAREVTFSFKRGLEAILYIASKQKKPTYHSVLKALYAADKNHLSNYGFLGSGDDYVAMVHGPVASDIYDLLKAARGDLVHPSLIAACSGVFKIADGKFVETFRSADSDWLSEAFRTSLDYGINHVGDMSFDERSNDSHDAAWHKARARIDPVKPTAAPKMLLREIADPVDLFNQPFTGHGERV